MDGAPVAERAAFDREGWRREVGNQAGESRRGAMLPAARAAGLAEGAPRDVVIDLLGEPDVRQPGLDIWYLGRSATGPSFETLEVRYGDDLRVSAIRIARS